jgi:acyl carrier protein
MISRATFEERLREFIAQSMDLPEKPDLPSEGNLFELGLLDSFAVIELINLLEDLSHSEVDILAIDPNEFFTVDGLYAYISAGPRAATAPGEA